MARPKSNQFPVHLTYDKASSRFRYRRPDTKKSIYLKEDADIAYAIATCANEAFRVDIDGLPIAKRQGCFKLHNWSSVGKDMQNLMIRYFHDLLLEMPDSVRKPFRYNFEQLYKQWPYFKDSARKYTKKRPIPRSKYTSLPSWATHMLYNCEKNARARDIEFTLREDDLRSMLASTNGYCSVTGVRLCLDENSTECGHTKRPYAPSIDRIDSNIGYAPGNCRIVCISANIAMGRWGEEVLLEMTRGIARKLCREA